MTSEELTGREDNICIFIPTITAGGAERVASQLANTWCNTRRVVVITYFDESHFFKLDPRIEVRCLGLRVNRGLFGRNADILGAAISFRRIVRGIQPRFVLSFMNKYNAFALAALYGTGARVFVSERGSPIEKLPWVRGFARDRLYPSAAGVVCQTQAGLDFITSRTNVRNATVIPNPVRRIIDPAERIPERVILSVGRFVPSKGFDQLIAAFASMRDQDWRLVLCGDGPTRPELEHKAKALGVADRVEFTGLASDLKPYYRRAGFFAFSSLHEGFPNALAEAMVSGLPCVSYDCPTGPSDMIHGEHNGLLVPVGDARALAAALDRLAFDRNFAERLGKRAAEAAEALDPERIADRYLAFCEQVRKSVR